MTANTPGATPPATTFGERLKQLRLAAGVRQNTLADAVGVGFPYISKIEKPDGPTPAPSVIAKIAEVLTLDEATTSELFALAAKIPPKIEALMASEREAMDFYRVAHRRLSGEQRRQYFRNLIEELEREGDPTSDASRAPNPDDEEG